MPEPFPAIEHFLTTARSGSRDALGQVFQAFRHYLLEIARVEMDPALRVKGGASDVVQDTFLEAARAFPRFHGETGPEVRAWLRRMLLRQAARHGRRYRTTHKRSLGREVPFEGLRQPTDAAGGPAADVETPSQGAARDEQLGLLLRAVEGLPEDYRQVIRLRYQEGRTFEEIGPLMGRTPNAVRLLWLRAVERVRQAMGLGGDD